MGASLDVSLPAGRVTGWRMDSICCGELTTGEFCPDWELELYTVCGQRWEKWQKEDVRHSQVVQL